MVEPFSLANNYGVLAYDHTHIFNVAYVIKLPSPVHSNAFGQAALDGWEFSGVTQYQKGAPLQPNTNGTLKMGFAPAETFDATHSLNANGAPGNNVLGTDSGVLLPQLICNPRQGLKAGQYYNPSCFSSPLPRQDGVLGSQAGVNGPYMWPYIHGPAYLDFDLSLYKTFKIKESKNIQFRVNAFNFVNHPLSQFGTGNDVNLSLNSFATVGNVPYSSGGIPVTPASCPAPVLIGTGTSAGYWAPPGCNVNPISNGKPEYKVGRRVMEFAVKFNF